MDPEALKQQVSDGEAELAGLDDEVAKIRREAEDRIVELAKISEPLRTYVASTRALLAARGIELDDDAFDEDDPFAMFNTHLSGPRGVAAVLQVMSESPGERRTVSQIADAIAERGWIDATAKGNIQNATRTNISRAMERNPALIRRVEQGVYVYHQRDLTEDDTPGV